MPKLKFKTEERLARAEAAARLKEIAEALKDGAKFELERGGEKLELELDAPEDVRLEFEVEFEDGKAELEVEIKWGPVTPPATPAGPGSESQF